MARVVALVPDLMFGSRVLEMLEGAGHEVTLTGQEDEARIEAEFADVLVVDLTTDAVDGLMLVDSMAAGGDSTRTWRRTCAIGPSARASTWWSPACG